MNEFQTPWKTENNIFLSCTRINKLTILETSNILKYIYYILKTGISFDLKKNFLNKLLIYIIVLQPFWREKKNNIPKQSVMKQH